MIVYLIKYYIYPQSNKSSIEFFARLVRPAWQTAENLFFVNFKKQLIIAFISSNAYYFAKELENIK